MSIYDGFKVLVCGGRDFNDWFLFNQAMDKLPKKPTLIIHGDARGADTMAKQWGLTHGIYPVGIPALWKIYDKKAGGHRNAAMVFIMKPDYVLALPGGTGTQDMVDKATETGITTWRPYG